MLAMQKQIRVSKELFEAIREAAYVQRKPQQQIMVEILIDGLYALKDERVSKWLDQHCAQHLPITPGDGGRE